MAIVLTSLVVLPLAGWALFALEKRHRAQETARTLRGIAELIAENSAATLLFNDPASAYETLARLRTEEQIKRAAIYDGAGKLYAWYPTNLPASAFPPQPRTLGVTFDKGDLLVVQPIAQGQVRAGLLYLHADLLVMRERLRHYAAVLALVLVGSGILALGLAHMLQKQITQPVLALAATTKRIATEQDFTLRAEKLSNDELGSLAEAFNQMLAQVQQHQAQLTAELSQRTKAEEALRRSHQQLQLISDNVPALISYVDASCRYQFCNLAYTLWFGLHPDKIMGRHMSEILGEGAWAAVRPHVESALAGRPAEFETEAHYTRGGTRWIHAIYTPDRDPSGKIAGIVVMVHDITERKKAEHERGWLAAVVESSNDAIITKTLDGAIRTWNAAAERLFGYSASEVIGKSITLIVPPERLTEEMEILQRLRHGERTQHYETTRKTSDGRLIDVSLTVSPVKNASGEILAASSIVRDISAAKRAERELKEAQAKLARHAEDLEERVAERTRQLQETIADLEAFSYSISHDMRAPLRTIRGYAEMLLDAPGVSGESSDFLQRITKSASRMDKLIQDVLAYSRLSKAQLELRPLNLDAIFAEVIQHNVQFQPPLAKIEIRGTLGSVLGHEAAMTQVVVNLLSNAVKFVVPGTVPEVRVWSEESRTGGKSAINLFVEDNGIGIPAKDFNRIFGIFERLHAPGSYDGTGIGLSMVKKAVERMGGTVLVRSEVGQGSCFCVQLPKA